MKKRFEILKVRWVVILVFALIVLGVMFFVQLRAINLEPGLGELSCDKLEGNAKCDCLGSAEKELRETINNGEVCESESQCDEVKVLVNRWTDLLEEIRVQCG